jgi:hypothetical protein
MGFGDLSILGIAALEVDRILGPWFCIFLVLQMAELVSEVLDSGAESGGCDLPPPIQGPYVEVEYDASKVNQQLRPTTPLKADAQGYGVVTDVLGAIHKALGADKVVYARVWVCHSKMKGSDYLEVSFIDYECDARLCWPIFARATVWDHKVVILYNRRHGAQQAQKFATEKQPAMKNRDVQARLLREQAVVRSVLLA